MLTDPKFITHGDRVRLIPSMREGIITSKRNLGEFVYVRIDGKLTSRKISRYELQRLPKEKA